MIKSIILLFNLMGLFLYQLFFQANVNVNQNVPASADAGTSFTVEVTINKADVGGFAKYEEDFPAGFTAEAVEKKGATVLSSGNAIKFIWASLPSDATFKISIKVTADASVTGAQVLNGKFLYVVNNERQQVNAAAATITINGKAAVAANTTPDNTQPAATNTVTPVATNTTPDNTQPAATNTVTPVATNTAPDNTQPAATNTVTPVATNTTPDNTQPAAANTVTPVAAAPSINITRSYSTPSVAPAGDETVTLTIHKGTLSGFAKLEETIPNGLVIAEGEKQSASFSFVDNKAKFVWLSLPSDSVFTVTYKISVGSIVTGDQSIAGELSYLVDNNAKTYTVNATSFSVQGASQPTATNTQTQPAAITQTEPAAVTQTQPAVVAQTEPAALTQTQPAVVTQTEPAAVTQTQPAVVAQTEPAMVTQTQPAATVETNNNTTPEIPAASGSIKYRVQIMALHNPVKATMLARRFGISEAIKLEMLEGYTKYTVGSFDEYKAVRDHREEVKSKGVQGPFVVAYNAGKRVTVQEALMITHQQWYQ